MTGDGDAGPRPADADLDETGYATRIEDAFIAERGTPFLVSSKDWGLIRGWRESGVPADTVVRAVREAFEKRRARGQAGKISSLAYCASAVEERWEMERRGLVGKEDAPRAAAADAAAIRETLAALAAGLRTAEAGAAPGEGPFEEISLFRTALLKAASKIEALSPDLSFEEVERALASIESSLVRSGLKAMNSSSQALVESRVDSALGDVAGLSAHVVERMRAALTRREVRALSGFPPLTLLHG
jgi:hypothetical protein